MTVSTEEAPVSELRKPRRCWWVLEEHRTDRGGYIPVLLTEGTRTVKVAAGNGDGAAAWDWGNTRAKATGVCYEANERDYSLSRDQTREIVAAWMFAEAEARESRVSGRISRAEAEECLTLVRNQFGVEAGADNEPMLHQPNTGWGRHWTITWNPGHEWALRAFTTSVNEELFNATASQLREQGVPQGQAWARAEEVATVHGAALPRAVWVEPVNGYSLALLPE